MLIKVIELCDVEPGEDQITRGKRVVIYQCSCSSLEEAEEEYNNKFDSNNIIDSEDYFEGPCLDSKVIRVFKYVE